VLNGAVIFVHGPMRWVGLILCAGVTVLWFRHRRSRSKFPGNPPAAVEESPR